MSAFDTQCLYQVKEKRQQQKTDNNLLLVCPLLCFFLSFRCCLSFFSYLTKTQRVENTRFFFSSHTHIFQVLFPCVYFTSSYSLFLQNHPKKSSKSFGDIDQFLLVMGELKRNNKSCTIKFWAIYYLCLFDCLDLCKFWQYIYVKTFLSFLTVWHIHSIKMCIIDWINIIVLSLYSLLFTFMFVAVE